MSFNLTDQTALFKINYYKKSENMYNSANVLQGRLKKRYDFTGRQRYVATPLSFSGGVGSGTLPSSNAGNYVGAEIESKRVYATCSIERESIKASANDAGAFVRATAETVKKTVESYMRNASRILFGDGTGVLGTGDGTGTDVIKNAAAAVAAYPLAHYEVTFPVAEWKEANWEERDYVQVVASGTAETQLHEVYAVDPSTRTVRLLHVAGASTRLDALAGGPDPLAATDEIAMQGSYNNDPIGLNGILLATSGSLYGIPVQRRWSSHIEAAAGKGVTVDLMNGVMLDVEKRFGKAPNMIMASYAQYQNILALLEDQKVYNLPNKNIKGNLSFQGVEFMSTRGPIGLFVDRFCDDDKIYFLNDNFIECHHRPGFGWFDDDGTVFLREASEDSYSARYGGYYQNYITPTAHGVLSGLAI